MIKVSVIIPVYNVENYIEQCIESIVNQTLKEIEIIIVNDGSTDNSMKNIEKYLKDPRIIIINQENKGVSSARNAGLKIARGEYISFIDSDDFIEETMIEDLYNNSEDLDIIFSGLNFYYNNNCKIEPKIFSFPFKKEKEKAIYYFNYATLLPCNKMYKKNFLRNNNILFEEKIIHEDDLFNFKAFIYAKEVKFIDKYHYYYRINRKGSIMATLKDTKELESYKKIYKIMKLESDKLEKDEFKKLRVFLWTLKYKIIVFKFEKKVNDKDNILYEDEILKLEKMLKGNYTNFSKIEKKIIKEDIQYLFNYKYFKNINLLDIFYWKNRIFTLKNIRRLIKNKIIN